jgi:hypothetical protein
MPEQRPSYFNYMNRLTRAGSASRVGVIEKKASSGFGIVGGYGGQIGRLGYGGSGQLGALKNRPGFGGMTVGGYTPGGIWPQRHDGPPSVYATPPRPNRGNVFDKNPAPTQGVPPPPSPQEQEAKRVARDERTRMLMSRAKGIATTIGTATSRIGNKAGTAAASFGKDLAREASAEYSHFQSTRKKETQPGPFESVIKKVHAEPESLRREEQELRRGGSG